MDYKKDIFTIGRVYPVMIELLTRGFDILRSDGPVEFSRSVADFMHSKNPVDRETVPQKASQALYFPPDEPCSVMQEDWDHLIILDGCRYDLFESVNFLDGELEFRISPGSATPEFLMASFAGKQFHDTVYVTANPMYRTRDLNGIFHDVVDVWAHDWDPTHRTVLPSDMSAAAIEAEEEFPHKRIITHFMQPHYPFIGPLSEEIGDHAGNELTYRNVTGSGNGRDHPTVWQLVEQGEVDEDLAWEAYAENLRIALEHVQDLLTDLTGRIVVTSDHGNLVGEKLFPFSGPVYGHPKGYRHEHLCKVPWLVIEDGHGDRKERRVSQPADETDATTGAVADRLRDLGYADLPSG